MASAAKQRATTRGSRPKRPSASQRPPSPARSGWVIRAGLVVAAVGVCVAAAYLPVSQYLELRSELGEVQVEGEANEAARRAAMERLEDSRRRNAERARCFNTWVDVGEETYEIAALATCDD